MFTTAPRARARLLRVTFEVLKKRDRYVAMKDVSLDNPYADYILPWVKRCREEKRNYLFFSKRRAGYIHRGARAGGISRWRTRRS